MLQQLESSAPGPTACDFKPPDGAVERVIAAYVRETFDTHTSAWKDARAREISRRTLGMRTLIGRLLTTGRNARRQEEVRSGYEFHWAGKGALEQYVAGLNDRALCVEWRQRGIRLAPQGLRQVHLLYLMRAIEILRPRSVLEVGFGNGNLLLTLAARFPTIEFHGVELTEAGLGIAQEVQAQEALPAHFVAASPEPLLDLTAHRSVHLRTADARELPFADRGIDLVYSRLALEQMEAIRHRALSEIMRVAAHAVVLIEPWHDFNREDPGRGYIRRQGYFAGRVGDVANYGFRVVLATDDLPQKVQFKAGPVIAVRG